MIYKTDKYINNFCQFRTIWSVGRVIYILKSNIDEAGKKQSELLMKIMNFSKQNQITVKRKQKRYYSMCICTFWR